MRRKIMIACAKTVKTKLFLLLLSSAAIIAASCTPSYPNSLNAKKALELLKVHEGFSPTLYYCTSGKPTIGYGLNLEQGITKEEADALLKMRVAKIKEQLSQLIPSFSRLSEQRQGVLVDMAYNLGVSGLLQFKRMLSALNRQDYTTASKEMLNSKWAEQVGQRAVTLARIMVTNSY